MFKNGARYNGIGPYLKEIFSSRIVKASVDAGFTCPNRDGTISTGGCIFCSETGSGDFTGCRCLTADELNLGNQNLYAAGLSRPNTQSYKISKSYKRENPMQIPDIASQIDAQLIAMKRKWNSSKCIVYFQNYTNTYAPVPALKIRYEQALAHPACIGIAIATRPDCIDDEVLEYITELNRRTFLWVELGLQTTNDSTAEYINRAYPLKVYDAAIEKLVSRGIRTVTHLIFGLPGETKADMMESVRHVCQQNIFGIKIQLLHIIKGTRLGEMYEAALKSPRLADGISKSATFQADESHAHAAFFPADRAIRPLEKEEYISLVADALEIIPPDITIHRLTGDAPKNLLLAPMWSTDKKSVLNGINMELKKRKSFQGCRT